MILLVTSAAYVSSDLNSEFGNIPPAFLPVQNKRLFNHLFASVPRSVQRYLSLPSDYDIDTMDLAALGALDVSVLRVPNGLCLGESVLYAINFIGRYDVPLAILHGDTLIEDLSYCTSDSFVVGRTTDNYEWASIAGEDPAFTYAGYFCFSDVSAFVRCLLEEAHRFVDALEKYRSEFTVSLKVTDQWRDFGHANTYYRSKASMSTEREFNSLAIDARAVRKSSDQVAKLVAEAAWYRNLPSDLGVYAPKLLSEQQVGNRYEYTLEYLCLSTLSELFVFGRLPSSVWGAIFAACEEFLRTARKHRPDPPAAAPSLFGAKTQLRLRQFSESTNIELDQPWRLNGRELPSLSAIVELTNAHIPTPTIDTTSLIHGDFCFSNILFDFRSQSIKTIDPRGLNSDGHVSHFGDPRYDVAKFAHSILGMYDLIVAGHYYLEASTPYEFEFEVKAKKHVYEIQSLFLSRDFAGFDVQSNCLYPMVIQLFLSMLPLHADSTQRQQALLANVLRLFGDFANAM